MIKEQKFIHLNRVVVTIIGSIVSANNNSSIPWVMYCCIFACVSCLEFSTIVNPDSIILSNEVHYQVKPAIRFGS